MFFFFTYVLFTCKVQGDRKKNSSGMADPKNVSDLISLGNTSKIEHLENNIDDVFLLSNGIVVCCE
jgi:hypothetical protein